MYNISAQKTQTKFLALAKHTRWVNYDCGHVNMYWRTKKKPQHQF